ncbi:hypothetical protein N657DRAFT_641870 [Parathielavia appendiculata]|uniref:Uncharacterized protein n=1 Tax=Parathielavia appendiculata TaxID=2587402 RepID=A0AAN6U7E8_9PEZI|nr:hypothetical protein N657DRAFT_641870 [Parathielavia appendiculata]
MHRWAEWNAPAGLASPFLWRRNECSHSPSSSLKVVVTFLGPSVVVVDTLSNAKVVGAGSSLAVVSSSPTSERPWLPTRPAEAHRL